MFNKGNLKYFALPKEADNWVWRIEHGVSEWVGKQGKKGNGDKSYWKLVFWVSQTYLKILIPNMSLQEFAQLLMEECPHAFHKEETRDTLFYSMQKFEYNKYLKDFDNLHNTYVSSLVDELEELLTKDVERTVETSPSLEQRMHEYAKNAIATGSYDKVCVNPTYNGKRVSLSVEKYLSKKYMEENRPSYVIIFECVEAVVNEDTVNMLFGKISTLSSIPSKKLFIASTHFFNRRTQIEAGNHGTGLVLVNLEYEVNEDNIVVPRSSEHKNYNYWRQMLSGEKSMTLSFIACDGPYLFYSMEDILKDHHFSVNSSQDIKAPYLSNADIEEIAMSLVKPQVDYFVTILQKCVYSDNIPECIINPYALGESLGLHIESGYTGENIAHIDIERKTVTICGKLGFNYHCTRFGMSHEVGHFVLHSDMIVSAKRRRQEIKPREKSWMEHHANYFASCLLMPAPVVKLLFNIFVRRNIYGVSSVPLNRDRYVDQFVIVPIARIMNVSVEAATIRLVKMGLVYTLPQMPPYLPEN